MTARRNIVPNLIDSFEYNDLFGVVRALTKDLNKVSQIYP